MPINCNGETGTKSRRCKIPEARLHMHFHQIVDSTKILPQSVIRLVILRQGVADAVVRLLSTAQEDTMSRCQRDPAYLTENIYAIKSSSIETGK